MSVPPTEVVVRTMSGVRDTRSDTSPLARKALVSFGCGVVAGIGKTMEKRKNERGMRDADAKAARPQR